jgi:hypothetical protein
MTHEQRGAATVSVDWNMNAGRGSSAPRGEEAMLAWLLELFERYESPRNLVLARAGGLCRRREYSGRRCPA